MTQPAIGAPPPESPTFHSWIWADRTVIARPAHGADVTALLHQHPHALGVTELRRSHASRLADSHELDLDRWAVEDLGSDSERPRLDVIGDTVVVLTRTIRLNPITMDVILRPLGVLVTDRLVAVVEDDAQYGRLTAVLEDACPSLSDIGTAGVLHAVLDHVVRDYTDALATLETKADTLAEALFGQHPLNRAEQLEAFRLRRALSQLLRVVEPMRDVTATLAKAAARPDPVRTAAEPADGRANHQDADDDPVVQLLPDRSARRFDDVADHVAHAADLADGQRDVLASLYETSLSLADVRLNTIMKKLSAWAAIIAVPTLITGFMGMNVPYPGFATHTGFAVSVGVMIGAVVTLFALFRRNDWL